MWFTKQKIKPVCKSKGRGLRLCFPQNQYEKSHPWCPLSPLCQRERSGAAASPGSSSPSLLHLNITPRTAGRASRDSQRHADTSCKEFVRSQAKEKAGIHQTPDLYIFFSFSPNEKLGECSEKHGCSWASYSCSTPAASHAIGVPGAPIPAEGCLGLVSPGFTTTKTSW